MTTFTHRSAQSRGRATGDKLPTRDDLHRRNALRHSAASAGTEATLNQSPAVQSVASLQMMLDASPRAAAQARLSDAMNASDAAEELEDEQTAQGKFQSDSAPVRTPPSTWREAVAGRKSQVSSAGDLSSPVQRTAVLRFAPPPRAAQDVVQRVITFTKYETGKDTFDPDRAMTPEEFCDAIGRTAAYQALVKACRTRNINEEEIHGQIVDYVTTVADGQTVDSRNAFLKQLERDAKDKFPAFLGGGDNKQKAIKEEADRSGPTLLDLLGREKGREALHKLAFVRNVNPELVNTISVLAAEVLEGVQSGLISPVEMQGLFSKLTTPQPHNEVAPSVQGYLVSVEGIVGELAGEIHVLRSGDVAPGERIFSGSEYAEAVESGESHKQEVDISYIDKAGVLHLIEAANSYNVLKNKVLGSSPQKKNYTHLSGKARQLEQTAPGGFTETQAQPQVVRAVEFSYVIPNDEPLAMVNNEKQYSLEALKELDDVLRALRLATASLRIGLEGKTWSVSDLDELRLRVHLIIRKRETDIERNTNELTLLNARDPDELSVMERVQKASLRNENLNLIYGTRFGI